MGRIIESKNISLDNECELITLVPATKDTYGKPLNSASESKVMLFCGEFAVTSNESFAARGQQIKAEIVLVLNDCDYQGQTIVDYENKRYSIYRKFRRTDGYIELYCQERAGNG